MRSSVVPVLVLLCLPAFSQDPYTKKLAPYVASPGKVVDMMLEMARIKPGETVYDLGSGDGRILIAAADRYKARAVGIEISPSLVAAATEQIKKAGLSGRATAIQGSVLQADFSSADVVIIYMNVGANAQTATISGLLADTDYYFRIRANAGTAVWSDWVTATPFPIHTNQ